MAAQRGVDAFRSREAAIACAALALSLPSPLREMMVVSLVDDILSVVISDYIALSLPLRTEEPA